MREFVTPGEIAAVLGQDSKLSRYQIWERLLSGDRQPISEQGRWQGRLATPIMEGVATDHNLKVKGALESTVSNFIQPPRLWKIAPSLLTGGHEAVLYVAQRQSSAMFGWKEPATIPERDRHRMLGIATAAECNHVLYGVLIDGYQSAIFHFSTTNEERAALAAKVEAFIQDVRDEIEPELDYSQDSKGLKSGAITAKAMVASGAELDKLAAELLTNRTEQASLNVQAGAREKRINEIEAILIHMMMDQPKLETETNIIACNQNAKGRKTVTITAKNTAPLF